MSSHSFFPDIPAQDATARYRDVVSAALAEYTEHYQEYSKQPEQMDTLTGAWAERHPKLMRHEISPWPPARELNGELERKIGTYIEHQKVRDDMVRILKVYEDAIAYLSPPPVLDSDTLRILRNLGVVVIGDLKTGYDAVFTTGVAQLRGQQVLMQQLFEKIKLSLARLRQSLEPLAVLCNGSTGLMAAAVAAANALAGQTPYVNAAVSAHKARSSLERATGE